VKRRNKKYAEGLAHTFGAGTDLVLVARCQECDGYIASLLGVPTGEAWTTEVPADWRVAGRVLLWERQRPEADPADLPRAEMRRVAREVTGRDAGAEVDVFRPGGIVPLADLDQDADPRVTAWCPKDGLRQTAAGWLWGRVQHGDDEVHI
jgi:hypothetical protein